MNKISDIIPFKICKYLMERYQEIIINLYWSHKIRFHHASTCLCHEINCTVAKNLIASTAIKTHHITLKLAGDVEYEAIMSKISYNSNCNS